MRGVSSHAEGVILNGQAYQETGRTDADLAGEAHQAAGSGAVGLRGHDEHRIVEQRHQFLECVNPRLAHPLSIPIQPTLESHRPKSPWRAQGGRAQVALIASDRTDGSGGTGRFAVASEGALPN